MGVVWAEFDHHIEGMWFIVKGVQSDKDIVICVLLTCVLSWQQVTWLASWTENIQGAIKYVMLNPTSRLKVLSRHNLCIVTFY